MVLNLLLLVVFLSSLFTLWYLVSLKIPQLVAVPDRIIARRLEKHEDRLHAIFSPLKKFYQEKQYIVALWGGIDLVLYKSHKILLAIDAAVLGWLKQVRNREGREDEPVSGENAEYWKKLQPVSESVPEKSGKMDEVRRRK